MNSEWRAFLESQSARIDPDNQVCFPAVTTTGEDRLVDLSDLGLIAADGPDAVDFLQGQLTNDVRELSDRHTQLSGYCSPKGRMLANLRLIRLDETYLLQLPRTRLEPILTRLKRFILRSRTRLTDVSDDWVILGIVGPGAARRLADLCGPLPELGNGLARFEELALIRIPGAPVRFQLLGPPNRVKAIWQELRGQAEPADTDYWRLLDIRAGIPTVYTATAELFVPQMANMHLIDGVSFTKGCYTGQEVVARMQYLGRSKRRMYLAKVDSETPPRPGDELFSPDTHSQQGTGWVVDARAAGDNHFELLAVVEIESAEQDHVHLGGIEGPLLHLTPPPYGFPADGERHF